MTTPPPVLTRQQCGLRPPDLSRLSTRAPDRLVAVTIHCTVTPATDPLATWRRIQAEYLDGNNVNHQRYGDIPYNDGITADGRILSGRQHQYVGAHALSEHNTANRLTLGVALIGTGTTITVAARSALRFYLFFATIELGMRPLLFDHYDWRAFGGIATSCPSPPTAQFVQVLRNEARAGQSWWR